MVCEWLLSAWFDLRACPESWYGELPSRPNPADHGIRRRFRDEEAGEWGPVTIQPATFAGKRRLFCTSLREALTFLPAGRRLRRSVDLRFSRTASISLRRHQRLSLTCGRASSNNILSCVALPSAAGNSAELGSVAADARRTIPSGAAAASESYCSGGGSFCHGVSWDLRAPSLSVNAGPFGLIAIGRFRLIEEIRDAFPFPTDNGAGSGCLH